MINFDKKLQIYYSAKINDVNFFSGFGTRTIGDGINIENITEFFRKNKIKYRELIRPEQVHGDKIFSFAGNGRDHSETDGLITSQAKIILTIITADCVPLIFADKKKGIVGISHQGWKGTYKKLAIKMVNKMLEQGSDKDNIIVSIGPSINDCCYAISQDMYNSFQHRFPKYTDKIFRKAEKKVYMNLAKLNYLQLIDIGIKKENIDFSPFCTFCNKDKFFSYRRDGKENLKEMFSFIVKL